MSPETLAPIAAMLGLTRSNTGPVGAAHSLKTRPSQRPHVVTQLSSARPSSHHLSRDLAPLSRRLRTVQLALSGVFAGSQSTVRDAWSAQRESAQEGDNTTCSCGFATFEPTSEIVGSSSESQLVNRDYILQYIVTKT